MARRVVLATVGSLGDLHPFIAVGLALKARGFEPVIATVEEYREKVAAEGLGFHPVRPSVAQGAAERGLTPTEAARRLMREPMTRVIRTLIKPHLEESYQDLLVAAQGAGTIVNSSFAFAAVAAADTLRIPRVSLLLQPMLFFSPHDPPTIREIPGSGPWHRAFGRPAARVTFALMRLVARLQQPTRELRRRHGLPRLREAEILETPLRADLVIGLWSPHLAPRPPDAPANSAVVGSSFYDSEAGGPPRLAPELAAFVDAGEAPLVFTLGSFAVNAPGDFYETSCKVAANLGRRAVLLVGPEGARFAHMASDRVFVGGYAPHSLLFPRACAVIHHGGIGTTAQALRGGRPQLVCPALGDQPDNADRLVRLGVAKRLDLKRYKAARAEKVLRALLADADAQRRAAELGPLVAQEDGAAVAAEMIAQLIAPPSRELSRSD